MVAKVLRGLPEDVGRGADEGRAVPPLELGAEGVHAAAALLRHRGRHLVRHRGGEGAPAPRVPEDVELRELHRLHEGDGLGELLLALARKADDDVRGDGDSGHRSAGGLDQARKLPAARAAGHAVQGRVAAALQGQVEVGEKTPVGEELEEARLQVPGLERGEPQPRNLGFGQEARHQAVETAAIPDVVAVGTEVDPAQNHLAIAEIEQGPHLVHEIVGGNAAADATGDGRHAEGAAVVAAVLNLEEGARPGPAARKEEASPVEVGRRLAQQLGGRRHLQEPVLVGVADHQVDAGTQGRLGRELGVTAGDDNRGPGVRAPQLTDQLARLLRRDRGHRAGVENAELGGFTGTDDPVAGCGQRPGHGLDLADVEPASYGFETDTHADGAFLSAGDAGVSTNRRGQPPRRSLMRSRILAFSSSM